MKLFRLLIQILAITLLFTSYHVFANDDVATVTQNNKEATAEIGFFDFIPYLKSKDKQTYLLIFALIFALILLGVMYLIYITKITKNQANKIVKEVGDLKQVVVKKLTKKDEVQKAREEESYLSVILPAILLFFGIISVLMVFVVLTVYFSYFDWPLPLNHGIWGAFGDFVGGSLNAVLSLFGFVALLLTIVLQSQELSLSRHELRISANALQEQSKTVKLQQFEGTFFKLLDLHESIVNALVIPLPDGTIIKGSKCLLVCLDNFTSNYSAYYDDEKFDKDEVFKEFLKFIKANYDLSLTRYFTHLHNTLDFLDKDRTKVFVDEFGRENLDAKRFYMKIIRSLLTKGETGLLFYAGITTRLDNCGIFRNKEIIEKYALMMNARNMGWIKQEHCVYYDETAFVED